MKNILHNLHLIIGLLSGLVIFTVSSTGCIVAFEVELREFAYSELYEVKDSGQESYSLDSLKAVVEAKDAQRTIERVRVQKDPEASVEFVLSNKESVFVNPFTAKELGTYNRRDGFLHYVLKLHRNLLLEETGEWITGISALCFFFLILSGIVLWWPGRKNRKERFKPQLRVQRMKRNYSLHTVLGFYASWLILLTVITALIWSFEWAEKSMYTLTGSEKQERMEVVSVLPLDPTSEVRLSALSELGFSSDPECSELLIHFPENKKESYSISLRFEDAGIFNRQDQLFVDQYSGEVLAEEKFNQKSLGDRLRMSNEKLHTGRSFGMIGRWLVFFASLTCASMPITGFLIWRNKRRARRN